MAIILAAIAVLGILYYVGHVIYARNGHPLADIPGPIFCAASMYCADPFIFSSHRNAVLEHKIVS